MKQSQDIFRLHNLVKHFPGKPPVLAVDQVSLSVKEGEIFGIIGLSGAGKSTILRCFNGLIKPSAGQVFYQGQDLGTLSPKALAQLRQEMGMIFQQFHLCLQRTALANVMLPLRLHGQKRRQAKERALEVLRWVGLEDKAGRYPAQLSGGEQQRVGIARALASRPKVLLCDEPSSALDPQSTESLLSLLKKINEELGLTIVIITHQMSVIERIADRVAVMDQAQLVELASLEEIFYAPKSQMAKQLIYPEDALLEEAAGEELVRLVFDGSKVDHPIISDLSLHTGGLINILSANSRIVDGKTVGQMLIRLPANTRDKALELLKEKDIRYHIERSQPWS